MPLRKNANLSNEAEYGVEEKSAKITHDNKQFVVRIPNEIAEIMKIKKGDFIHFKVELAEEPKPIEESKLSITYVRK